jgi:Do/DeqQ family serine protease
MNRNDAFHSGGNLRAMLCAAVVAAAIVACGGMSAERTASQASAQASAQASEDTFAQNETRQPAPPPAGVPFSSMSYADIVSRVTPAVVTIRSEQRVRAPRQHPFMNDPFLREFFGDAFGDQPRREYRQQGLGSGVVVTPDGTILTNHHVVDGAEEIRVELSDGRILEAQVVGSDPPSDLAVLRVQGSSLPVLGLGDSDQARVGDVVLAIGNPLSIGQTVTAGIISAKGRTTGLSDGSFESFIQTDAAINQGNSGGALVNTAGELIGINSQILSPTGVNIGIGFAIPSNMARNVMGQLIASGRVRRGRLGVAIGPVTTEAAEAAGLSTTRGVLIAGVEPGSAAASAGLREGDIVTAVNGTVVNESNTLRNLIASAGPGAEVTLSVRRGRDEREVRARLGELRVESAGR